MLRHSESLGYLLTKMDCLFIPPTTPASMKRPTSISQNFRCASPITCDSRLAVTSFTRCTPWEWPHCEVVIQFSRTLSAELIRMSIPVCHSQFHSISIILLYPIPSLWSSANYPEQIATVLLWLTLSRYRHSYPLYPQIHFAAISGHTKIVHTHFLYGVHADRTDKHGIILPGMLVRDKGKADMLGDWLVRKMFWGQRVWEMMGWVAKRGVGNEARRTLCRV